MTQISGLPSKDWASRFPLRRDRLKRLVCISIAAIVFTLVLLKINHKLFTVPINEYSDYAANMLQIEDAKHFRDLLGNYSRWGFHHPGPVFLYIFALGEAVLHDWLRVTPEVMNAQLMTIILLNSIFLFAAIGIFAEHCRSRLFVPAAVASAIYVIYMVNHTIPGSAVMSIWMPHVLLFCFVLFAAVCPSVAAGNVKQLPILAFTGLMLVHGHVAQPLFVCPLAALALLGGLFSQGRQRDLKGFLRANRLPFMISALLVVVFAVPIFLDAVLHKPNNIYHIRAYMAAYRGLQNTWPQALKYEISFFTFLADSTIVTQTASARLISRGGSQPYVVVYWCFWCCLTGFTIGNLVYKRKPVPAFLKYLVAEIIIIMMLFLYWGMRMAGPLYNFNGYFFYSVQLLVLLGVVCFLLDGIKPSLAWPIVVALSCVVPLLMLVGKPYFQNAETGSEETDRLIAGFPARLEPVNVSVSPEDWLDLLGVISHMKRDGYRFCIADAYASLFDPSRGCHHITGLQNLILARAPRKCEAPCQTLEGDSQFVVQLAPYPWLKLPFQIDNDGLSSLNDNFHRDSGGMWSPRRSTIRFLLAPDAEQRNSLRVRITGIGIPGRPAVIFLNGQHLGTINGAQETSEFVVDGNILRPGQENDLTFSVEKARPIGRDWRDLGYFVKKIEFEVSKDQGR